MPSSILIYIIHSNKKKIFQIEFYSISAFSFYLPDDSYLVLINIEGVLNEKCFGDETLLLILFCNDVDDDVSIIIIFTVFFFFIETLIMHLFCLLVIASLYKDYYCYINVRYHRLMP
jgi:hypothetical protein